MPHIHSSALRVWLDPSTNGTVKAGLGAAAVAANDVAVWEDRSFESWNMVQGNAAKRGRKREMAIGYNTAVRFNVSEGQHVKQAVVPWCFLCLQGATSRWCTVGPVESGC